LVAVNRTSGKGERREEILNAAARVLARSVGSATMDDVAREAGLSKGGLYRHFQSKEELLIALAIRSAKAFAPLARAAAAEGSGQSSYATACDIVHASVSYANENSETLNLVVAMLRVTEVAEPLAPLLAQYHDAIADLDHLVITTLERGQQDGSVRTDVSARRLSANLRGALLGVLQILRGPSQARGYLALAGFETDSAQFVDVIMGALRPVASESASQP
jgi:AcrR family transcriptional regulator